VDGLKILTFPLQRLLAGAFCYTFELHCQNFSDDMQLCCVTVMCVELVKGAVDASC